ncbi:hypothetical protein [Actinoplanes sp. NPDC051494]|uniref:hypothetical protein n=1 Tax=Actinoplanes sp. NPDC051494 TaxID=3363907 RepID=UPI003788B8F2
MTPPQLSNDLGFGHHRETEEPGTLSPVRMVPQYAYPKEPQWPGQNELGYCTCHRKERPL